MAFVYELFLARMTEKQKDIGMCLVKFGTLVQTSPYLVAQFLKTVSINLFVQEEGIVFWSNNQKIE